MAFGVGMGALSLGTIFVAINANLTGLVSGTQLAKAHLGHFQRQVAAVSPQLQRLGMSATIAGAAIVAMGAMSVRSFARFEQEMANVGSVLGQHFKDMTNMRTIAREWGQTTIFSARETGQAMYYLASAGYNAEQTVEALGATLTLAGATMNDLSQTTQMMVAAMNAFAMETADADRVANAYAAAISKSQATAERLAISMRYVAPIAHNAGQEFEMVVAALGLLYNSGMEASMAGTSLRMSLVRLARLTPMARKELENLGIAAQDVDPTLHSLVDIIRQFEEHKITPRAASVIFGARALAGILNLVTTGADRLDQMTMSVTNTNKAYDMLDIQTDTFIKTMTKLKNAITEIVLQFGEGLVPLLREVAEGMREAAIAIGDMNPVLKQAASIVMTAGGAAVLLAGILSFLSSVLPRLVVGFKALGSVIGLLTGPYAILVALGAALIGVFWKVGQAVRESKKGLMDSLQADKDAIKTAGTKIEKLKELTNKYDELSAKEHKTATEMALLQEVMEAIKDLQPSLITGLDKFGKVIDIDRKRVSAYTDELIRHHNTQRLLHKSSWGERMAQLDDQRTAEKDVVNDYLDQIKAKEGGLEEEQAAWEKNMAAYEEFHRRKAEAAAAGFDDLSRSAADGVAAESQAVDEIRALGGDLALEKAGWKEPAILAEPGPAHPGLEPAQGMRDLEAAGDAAEKQLHATNIEYNLLVDAMRSLDPSGIEGPDLGISGEQIQAIEKDRKEAEDRIQALILSNMNDRYKEEAEEASRAHAENKALADALSAHQLDLGKKVKEYRSALATEEDGEKREAIQASLDRELGMIGELATQEAQLRTESATRLQQALIDIENRRREEELSNEKVFTDRLKALRIAAKESEYDEARASAEAQYAEDLAMAEEAGVYGNEIRILAALVLQQKLISIRKSELQEELDAEREKNQMTLTEYAAYLATRIAMATKGSDDYLALQAELVEAEAEINEQREQDWARFASSIKNSLVNATVDWLNALRRDADEAKEIWTALGQHIKDQIIRKALEPLVDALTDSIAAMLKEIAKLIRDLIIARFQALLLKLMTGGSAPIGGMGDAGDVITLGDAYAHTGASVQKPGIAVLDKDERVLSPKLTDLVEGMAEMPFPGAGFSPRTSPVVAAQSSMAAPWEVAGMSASDFFALKAIEHVDPIVVMPGAILSIDEDSVDDFLEKVLLPAKRRYAQRLRDATGEVIS